MWMEKAELEEIAIFGSCRSPASFARSEREGASEYGDTAQAGTP